MKGPGKGRSAPFALTVLMYSFALFTIFYFGYLLHNIESVVGGWYEERGEVEIEGIDLPSEGQ